MIIVGLGNYGDKYEYTYHNIGFLAIDRIARELGVKFNRRECDSLTAITQKGGHRLVLAKPQTYMNNSGIAVKQLVAKYGSMDDLLVIYDDIDIGKGSIRFREKGSAGTHNGMRSIIEKLGSQDFKRMRIGIGPVPENILLVNYVIGDMFDIDRPVLAGSVGEVCEYVLHKLIKI